MGASVESTVGPAGGRHAAFLWTAEEQKTCALDITNVGRAVGIPPHVS